MPYNHPTFELRGESGRVIGSERILEPTALWGIDGFAFHRKVGKRDKWYVSHIETGSLIAEGPSKREAQFLALEKSGSQSGVIDGIRRMREVIRRAEEVLS